MSSAARSDPRKPVTTTSAIGSASAAITGAVDSAVINAKGEAINSKFFLILSP
jgi:hypothetical protein